MYLFTAAQAVNHWYPLFCAVLVFATCALGAVAALAMSASRRAKQRDELHAEQVRQRQVETALRQRLAQITANLAV
jgi:uncharacterized membrane protein